MINWPVKFIEDKYSRCYERLILKAKERKDPGGYSEQHHIIPRSFGGDNSIDNLVLLTAKEHYIAHALLWKMNFIDDAFHSKMSYALRLMIFGAGTKKQLRNYKCHSRIYESVRIEFSKNHSSNMSGKNNPFYGKTHSYETLEKIKQTKKATGNWGGNNRTNYSISQKTKEKISVANKGRTWDKMFSAEELILRKKKRAIETSLRNKGKTLSQETKHKISETRKKLFAEGQISPPKGCKGLVPWNKGKKGIISQNSETIQKRLNTMRALGKLKPQSNPLIYRGIEYHNFGEIVKATGKTKSVIKTEIKYWGNDPSKEIIEKLDSRQVSNHIPANKGIAMTQEQRDRISKTKKEKNASVGEKNPNSKTYKLFDPSGAEYIVSGGLEKFCNDNGVGYHHVRRVLKGEKSNANGWTIQCLGFTKDL